MNWKQRYATTSATPIDIPVQVTAPPRNSIMAPAHRYLMPLQRSDVQVGTGCAYCQLEKDHLINKINERTSHKGVDINDTEQLVGHLISNHRYPELGMTNLFKDYRSTNTPAHEIHQELLDFHDGEH